MQYAVIWELTVRTKSAAVFSLASLVRFLLLALFGPFIGGVVDRFDRKNMIFSDKAIAVVTVWLVLLGLNGEISVGIIMAALYPVLPLHGLISLDGFSFLPRFLQIDYIPALHGLAAPFFFL